MPIYTNLIAFGSALPLLKLIILKCSMAAAFGSGAMFSLVSGFGGPNQAANAISSGLFFALIQGGIFKVSMS